MAVMLAVLLAFILFRYWVNHAALNNIFKVDMPLDLWIYLRGGERVIDRVPLYDAPIYEDLPFTYPPFAAWLFAGMSLLKDSVAAALWQLATVLGVAWVVWACLERLHVRLTPLFALIVPLIAAVFIFGSEPVHATLFWGQINVLLMVLVCLDFLPGKRRLPGIGVGLAAGLKLTPAFFGVLFLVQRRWWAAAGSFATFLATVALGYIFVPDAHIYWTDAAFNSERIGVHANPGAQSIKSILVRVYGVDSSTVWLAMVLAIVVLVVWAIALCVRHGNIPAAVGLTGIGACLISPFSWYHHWVWIVPFGVAVLVAANRAAAPWARFNPVRWQFVGALSVGALMLVIAPYCATSVAAGWLADNYSAGLQLSERSHTLLYVGGGLAALLGTVAYYLVDERNQLEARTTVEQHDLQLRGQNPGHP